MCRNHETHNSIQFNVNDSARECVCVCVFVSPRCPFSAGGLQVAMDMQRAKLDYVLIEKEPRAGRFFERLPRFGRLISINKRFMPASAPGGTNGSFALRHDWNSLLVGNDDDSDAPYPRAPDSPMRFTSYSDEFYPSARLLASYLAHVADTELPADRLLYNTTVVAVSRPTTRDYDDWDDRDTRFQLKLAKTGMVTTSDASDVTIQSWLCRRGLVWATNFGIPNDGGETLVGDGWKHAINYDDAPEDLDFYRNKSVLIVGGGNAAFEIARAVVSVATKTAVYTRRAPRLAWQTHYPGDVRGDNTLLFDRYQLKTLDLLLVPLSPESRISLQTVWPCAMRAANDVFESEAEEEDMNDQLVRSQLAQLIARGSRVARAALKEWESAREAAKTSTCTPGEHVVPRFEISEEQRGSDSESIMKHLSETQRRYSDGRILTTYAADSLDMHSLMPNSAEARYRGAYTFDIVIRALGWKWKPDAIFAADVFPEIAFKFPKLEKAGYGSANVHNLYFAGSLAHAHDWRRSSGGFIHGFRYTARALVRGILEDDDDTIGWPARSLHAHGDLRDSLVTALQQRAQNADGIYQMFSELCFVVRLRFGKDGEGELFATSYDDVPVRRLFGYRRIGGLSFANEAFITMTFEYGRHFHGERVLTSQGNTGEFIQPVLRFYDLRGLQHRHDGEETDNTTRCSSHARCEPCSGRCSRFTRMCICGEVPQLLTHSKKFSHWFGYATRPSIGKTGKPKASTHVLDEYSDVMPDFTVYVDESIDTEWNGLHHRLRIECFVDAVFSLLRDDSSAERDIRCPGGLPRESRALLSQSALREADDEVHWHNSAERKLSAANDGQELRR